MGYNITVSDAAKNFLAKKGFDPSYGARPLKRTIQKYIEDSVAEEILRSEIKEGDTIVVDMDKKDENLVSISIEPTVAEGKKPEPKPKKGKSQQ